MKYFFFLRLLTITTFPLFAADISVQKTAAEYNTSDDPSGESALKIGNQFHAQGDTARAIKWWELAAEKDNITAMNALGVLNQQLGHPEKAKEWFLNACDAESPLGMYNLGIFYEQQGNLDEARYWYHEASIRGDQEGSERLALVEAWIAQRRSPSAAAPAISLSGSPDDAASSSSTSSATATPKRKISSSEEGEQVKRRKTS